MAGNQGPIQLVCFDKSSHTFVLTSEGESYLRSLEKPIAILGIVGKQKTGKSFLADRVILDHKPSLSSTGVSHTLKQGTKGIWIYPEEIVCEQDPGKRIVVIDSQGLGSTENDSTYDSRIFSLSILLSSLVVYNSIGAIDEGALENIEFVGQLAKEIKLEDAKGKVCSFLFPSFFWLLRDFSLRLEDPQGKKISAQQYLESCLEQTKGVSEANEKRNKTRRVIKYLFEQRDCYTLVRPALTEFEVQRLDKLKNSEFRPEFLEQCKKLRTKILNSVEVKIVAKTPATGAIIAEYLKSMLDTLNGNRTLVLPTLHASVVGAFNGRLLHDFKASVQTVESDDRWLAVWRQSIGDDDERESLRQALADVWSKEAERRRLEDERKKKVEAGFDLVKLNTARSQMQSSVQSPDDQVEIAVYERCTFGNQESPQKGESQGSPVFAKTKNHKSMIMGEEKIESGHGRSESNPRAVNFGGPQWISGPPSHIAGSLRGSTAIETPHEPAFWRGDSPMERQSLRLTVEEAVEKETIKVEIDLLRARLNEKATEQDRLLRDAENSRQTVEAMQARLLVLEVESSRQKLKAEDSARENERLVAKNIELKKKIESLQDQLSLHKENKEPSIPLPEHYSKLDEVRCQFQGKISDLEKSLLLKEQELSFTKKDVDSQKATIDELRTDKKQLYEDIVKLRSQVDQGMTSKGADDDYMKKTIEKNVYLEVKLREAQELIETLKAKNTLLEEEKRRALQSLEDHKKNSDQIVTSFQQQASLNTKSQDSQSASFTTLSQKHAACAEEVKSLKAMLDKAASLICSGCRSPVPVGAFPSHCCPTPVHNRSLLDSSILTLHKQPLPSSRRAGLQVEILEVMVKENRENRRLYVEYKMKAKRGRKEWEVIRKYKEFCEFWTEIQKKFSTENFSPMVKDLFKLSRGPEGLPSSSMADRHKTLQEFLSEVSLSLAIAASDTVKMFLNEPVEVESNMTFEEADDTMTDKAVNSFMLKDLDTPKNANSPVDRKKSISSALKESKSQNVVGLTKNKTNGSGIKAESKPILGLSSSSRRVNLAKYLPKK